MAEDIQSDERPLARAGNGSEHKPIQRRSLHREVVDRLRTMIVEAELTPGERIAEGEICEQLGISRTPLREALKVLASEGLIDLLPNRGTRVSRITGKEIGELFEVISGIERMAGELAADRATDKDIENLAKLQERMEQHHRNDERHQYFDLNQQVHELIVRMADNSVLIAVHANLMMKVRRARYLAIMSRGRWDESVKEHAEIREAIMAREPARAGALIMLHVRKTGEIIQKTFDPAQKP
ncbi:MAG: GntR family transcriptional regulator [Gammaproteobacteria bacterium]|nr:GntR family transcriptional regulator [Gammaproteobacteria bacterium]